MRDVQLPERTQRVLWQAAAWLLSYPDEQLLERLDLIESALAEEGVRDLVSPMLDHLRSTDLYALQASHTQEFDISRRHALHLTYWTDGDTRRRGEALLEFKQVYRDSGLLVDLDGELPDFLPMVLEFAVAEPAAGRALLIKNRPSIELLRLALRDDDLPQRCVVEAVCATLPGESPADRLAVSRMNGYEPPTESVGLAPFATRLPLLD
ncbi:nitrate reductase molybdenum cofactor assembly chaperone [Mariniluteicoccus flavus]